MPRMAASHHTSAGSARLLPVERWLLWVLLVVVIGFGGLVLWRSAFAKLRMTDAGAFFRAAWAIRADPERLYSVTDDRGWAYLYPPLTAILFWPLADPPAGEDRAGYLPYALSVGIWFVLSVGLLGLCCELLARSVARGMGWTVARGSRLWWALRVVPVLICLPDIGSTLSRGQVDLLMLAGVSLWMHSLGSARRLRGGLWLGLAGVVKLMPLFLVLLPLCRREGRTLAGIGLGVLLGVVVVPCAVLGPATAYELTQTWAGQAGALAMESHAGGEAGVLEGASGSHAVGADDHPAEALEDALAVANPMGNDNHSLVAILHRWMMIPQTLERLRGELSPAEVERMQDAGVVTGVVAAGVCLVLAGLACWPVRSTGAGVGAGGTGVDAGAMGLLLSAGCLLVVMTMITPGGHLHYFVFRLPLVAVLVGLAIGPGGRLRLSAGWLVLFGAVVVLGVLPKLPGLGPLRYLGLAAVGMWLLLGVGLVRLWRMGGAGPQPRTMGALRMP
mgnify:CR=1 FL=1